MPDAEYLVGVDSGGTKILAGVFQTSLANVEVVKLSTKAQRGPDAVIKRIARCIRDAVDEADLNPKQVRGVGIGAPGAVEGETGNVIFAPNLEWHDVPLKRSLEEELGIPVLSAVKNGQKTLLTEMLGENLDGLRSGDLRKAIRRGDKLVDSVVKEQRSIPG